MKNASSLILFSLLGLLLFVAACGSDAAQNTAEKRAADAQQKLAADSAAVVATVRGFFEWYAKLSSAPDFAEQFNFVDYAGAHPVLRPELLEKYLARFVESGFCGQAFAQSERFFYQKCAESWKTVEVGDVPPCLDADRYFCAQDDVSAIYQRAEVRVKFESSDAATATLTLFFSANDRQERSISLRKEGGKWLLAGAGCE